MELYSGRHLKLTAPSIARHKKMLITSYYNKRSPRSSILGSSRSSRKLLCLERGSV